MQLLHYNCPIEQLEKRYTLIRHLGNGGMADVYLAWDEHDHHEAAIKVIRPDTLDPRMLHRFLREGQVVASLAHPHIIHIYGDGIREETFTNPTPSGVSECKVTYIVMEHVKGSDLKKRLIPEQVYPLAKILHIFGQLCAAVQYAHDRGVIHRDIKPANILFREHPQKGDQVVLSDFGLALAENETISQPYAGTLSYMAPEQRDGDPQKAGDIFSLGVVLYQLCTGYLPFRASSLVLPIQQPKKPTLLNPSLPPALDRIILQALSNDPSQRFASASLFWQAIQSVVKETPVLLANMEQQPVTSPPWSATTEANPTRPMSALGVARRMLSSRTPSSRKRRAMITIALVMLMLLLLVFGALAVLSVSKLNTLPTPYATITIMPRLQSLSTTFSLTAKLGQTNVDTNAGTIPAKVLSSTQSNLQSGDTTGQADCVLWVVHCQQAVSQDDVDKLTTQIRPGLESQIEQDISQQEHAQGATPVGNIVYSNEVPTANPAVGTTSDTVTVTLSLRGSQEYIMGTDARAFALQMLHKQLKQNYTLIETKIQIGQPVVQSVDAQGNVQIKIAAAGVIHYTIPQSAISDIKNHIAGKSQQEARTFITQNPNLDPHNISIHLNYGDTLPGNVQQIKITEVDPSTMPAVHLPAIPSRASNTTIAYE